MTFVFPGFDEPTAIPAREIHAVASTGRTNTPYRGSGRDPDGTGPVADAVPG
jgi:hypothetical protein